MANSNTDPNTNVFPVHRLMEILSQILSEKYGCKITMTAIPKNQAMQDSARNAETPEQQVEVTEQKAG